MISSAKILFVAIVLLGFAASGLAQNNLEEFYKTGSKDKLLEFYEGWEKESASIPRGELANRPDWERNSYEIFEDFYSPFNLKRLSDRGGVRALYTDVLFVTIQNSLSIKIAGKSRESGRAYSINNFRPLTKMRNTRVLFLTEKYKNILLRFLGDKGRVFGSDGTPESIEARQELLRRAYFLRNHSRVIPGHWGGWHLTTHPDVTEISFDESMTKAKVKFRIKYQGGAANYIKKGGKWVLLNSLLIWIE